MTKQGSGAAFVAMLFMVVLLLFFGDTDVKVNRQHQYAMVFCPSCGKKKPAEDFGTHGYRRNRVCKACEESRIKK